MGIGRGKIIGRSHSVNGQVFLRGLPWDNDSWAVAGNNERSVVNVLPLLRKLETDLVRATVREQMMNPACPATSGCWWPLATPRPPRVSGATR